MFNSVKLHGGRASVLWGHRSAAVLSSWTIRKGVRPSKGAKPGAKVNPNQWTLTATLTQADRFQLRQTPLLFTAPRDKGFWLWPIESLELGTTNKLVATLGPPEQ